MFRAWLVLLAMLWLSACSTTPKSIVEGPLTVRPPKQASPAAQNGAIYQASTARLNLFEDRVARSVGDTLTIVIEEKVNTQNKSETTVTRDNTMTAAAPTVTLPKLPLIGSLTNSVTNKLSQMSVDGSSSTDFSGKGNSTNASTFTGSITVTVVDVLNNGNLVVAGEKQIATNRETLFVRLSGVVDPRDLKVGNMISSTKVADARIEQRGDGQVDSAQAMGWLGRFFLSFLPF